MPAPFEEWAFSGGFQHGSRSGAFYVPDFGAG